MILASRQAIFSHMSVSIALASGTAMPVRPRAGDGRANHRVHLRPAHRLDALQLRGIPISIGNLP
jgi:hypothetical protein